MRARARTRAPQHVRVRAYVIYTCVCTRARACACASTCAHQSARMCTHTHKHTHTHTHKTHQQHWSSRALQRLRQHRAAHGCPRSSELAPPHIGPHTEHPKQTASPSRSPRRAHGPNPCCPLRTHASSIREHTCYKRRCLLPKMALFSGMGSHGLQHGAPLKTHMLYILKSRAHAALGTQHATSSVPRPFPAAVRFSLHRRRFQPPQRAIPRTIAAGSQCQQAPWRARPRQQARAAIGGRSDWPQQLRHAGSTWGLSRQRQYDGCVLESDYRCPWG